MSAEEKDVKTRIDLDTLARTTLEESKGDFDNAVKLLEEHAIKDTTIWNEWTQPLIHQACYDILLRARIADRGKLLKSIERREQHGETNGADRVAAEVRSIFDTPLPHNRSITVGDATHADLLKASDAYRKTASTMLVRARWMELLAGHVKGRRKVKNALDEAQADRLYMEALNNE